MKNSGRSLKRRLQLLGNRISRIKHRKGHGVHSPFAFAFVTDVLYNNEQYYAYEKMDSGLRWWHKGRLRRVQRLLFRLANYRQPVTLYSDGIRNKMQEALKYYKLALALDPSLEYRANLDPEMAEIVRLTNINKPF